MTGGTGGMAARTIRIAVALIADDAGRLLLVRKAGSPWFMQAGGKIEAGEDPAAALRRELREELGIVAADADIARLGRASAPAANEPGHRVDADIFRVLSHGDVAPGAEIEEAIWVMPDEARGRSLAPLTRDHILPLAERLRNTDAAARRRRAMVRDGASLAAGPGPA